MSRHAWAYRDGLPSDVTACSLTGCPWQRRMDSGGRLTFRLAGEVAWQAKAPPCEGTPAQPKARVYPSRMGFRGGERKVKSAGVRRVVAS